MREEDPVHWSPSLGLWFLTRHDDVLRVLRDPVFSVDRSQVAAFKQLRDEPSPDDIIPRYRAEGIVSIDPPAHTRLRRVINKSFTTRIVEGLRPTIQRITEDLLSRVDGRTEFDVVTDLANPLPATVISELLGVPSQGPQFKAWSDDIVVSLDGPFIGDEQRRRAEFAARAMVAYFEEVLEERASAPRPDLIGRLLAAEREPDGLTRRESIFLCMQLVNAGHETTRLIASSINLLASHPEQLAAVRRHPELVGGVVEESLRYESPIHHTARVTLEDVDVRGRRMAKHQGVVAVIAAAKRDPEMFENPETFDVTRRRSGHLAFGEGPHVCLGAQLGRAEGEIALRTVLDRFPRLALRDEPPAWRPRFFLRSLEALRVSV